MAHSRLGAHGSDERIRDSQHAALVLDERLNLPQAAPRVEHQHAAAQRGMVLPVLHTCAHALGVVLHRICILSVNGHTACGACRPYISNLTCASDLVNMLAQRHT